MMEIDNVDEGEPMSFQVGWRAEDHQGSAGTLLKNSSQVSLINSKAINIVRPVLMDHQQATIATSVSAKKKAQKQKT
jgi:hypothetical protein